MPTITSTSGTWTHDGSVTVSGSGFGTKATAAPVVWDNCNHGQSLATRWDGGWPSANATYNLDYRVEQRSIAMPHSRTTKYLAGCHYGTGGADAGFNVMGWKNRTLGAFPQFCLMSFRFRGDDGWDFTCGSPCDDNLKHFDYSTGTSPYDPSNWYISKSGEPHPWTPSTGLQFTINDDGASLENPDQNAHNFFWNSAVNDFAGAWSHIIIFNRYTDLTTGRIVAYENNLGSAAVNYIGKTDLYTGTARNEAFGGYARNQTGATQWRYFCDVYLDDTWACVFLGNASTSGACTAFEMQIPTAWADGSITVTANLGAFGNNDTAWLYVLDSNGSANANGFEVLLGSGGGVISERIVSFGGNRVRVRLT